MTKRTAKMGITGKWGTRYGGSLRKIAKKFEISQHAKYVCPFCAKSSVRRTHVGIWKCTVKNCNKTIAGGAYELATPPAVAAKTTMNRLKKLREEQAAENKRK